MRTVKTSVKEEFFIDMHTPVIMSCKYNDGLSFACSGFLHFPLLTQPIPSNATRDKRHIGWKPCFAEDNALQPFFVLV